MGGIFVRSSYVDGRILSDEDVPEPVEVAEPSLDFVLEGNGVHFVDGVLLGEESFVDDLGTGQPKLLSDLDLQSGLAIEFVEFRFLGRHRVVGEVLSELLLHSWQSSLHRIGLVFFV